MTQDTLLRKTEKALALVRALQAERDEALAELVVGKVEKDQLAAMPAQVESNVLRPLGSAQLTQKPQNEEQQLELGECRKDLQQTKAELEHTKDELRIEKFKLRLQAMKMRRLRMLQQTS